MIRNQNMQFAQFRLLQLFTTTVFGIQATTVLYAEALVKEITLLSFELLRL